jgi:hypothetical protein
LTVANPAVRVFPSREKEAKVEKVAVDIVIKISYSFNDPEQTVIKTNARKEALEELLSNWVQDQISTGADDAQPADKDPYEIKIGLILENDQFLTESDTGNRALTCGIVMDVLGCLGAVEVLPYS